jgi:hypothetical protein
MIDPDDPVPTHELGTGQGIDSAYTEVLKLEKGQPPKPVHFCDSALFVATEIDSVAAHAGMPGATLRKAYTGKELGARYANKEKRRPTPAHNYRFALIAGIQPERSGLLLNDADGGTPQRWLWFLAFDPDAPEELPTDVGWGEPKSLGVLAVLPLQQCRCPARASLRRGAHPQAVAVRVAKLNLARPRSILHGDTELGGDGIDVARAQIHQRIGVGVA